MSVMHPKPSVCRIWRAAAGMPPAGAPDVDDVPCALVQGRYNWDFAGAPNREQLSVRAIYLPAGTDVRITPPTPGTLNGDTIELPKASGTFYKVVDVQDMNKDTPQEERRALAEWTLQNAFPIV
jgi:hypothetical protein